MKSLILRVGESKRINTETRLGTPIINAQSPDLTEWELKESRDIIANIPKHQLRTGACGFYNCHGLTFGSRRTQIDELNTNIVELMVEDQYKEVREHSEVKSGDVVIYFKKDGSVIHSGIVAYERNFHEDSSIKNFMVVSKWGSGPEVIHSQYDCPYGRGTILKFFRVIGTVKC